MDEVEETRHSHAVTPKDETALAEAISTDGEVEVANTPEPLDWWIEALPEAIRENVSKPAWHITGPDTAAWAEERFYEIFARKEVNDLQLENTIERLQAEIDRIKHRNEERNKPFIDAMNFFGYHLMNYALQLRQQDESVKSWKGLYMTIGTRSVGAKFEITDKEKFAKWLTDNGKTEWYDLEIKPKKAIINKAVDYQGVDVIDSSTGEIIPGATAEQAHITAKIEVEEETDPASGQPVLHPVRQLYVFGQESV